MKYFLENRILLLLLISNNNHLLDNIVISIMNEMGAPYLRRIVKIFKLCNLNNIDDIKYLL